MGEERIARTIPYFQRINNGLRVDGQKNPLIVVVRNTVSVGDVLRVVKLNGDVTYVGLKTEVPYYDPAKYPGVTRYTFDWRNEDGSEHLKTTGWNERSAERERLSADDGWPRDWCRRESNGKVFWPQDDDIWENENTGALGRVVKDRMYHSNIGWCPLSGGKGVWFMIDDFMNDHVFVFRKYKQRIMPVVTNSHQVYTFDGWTNRAD